MNNRGVPKSMKQVLEERGVNTTGMKAEKISKILDSHCDINYEKTKVEQYLNERKHRVICLFPNTIVNSTQLKEFGASLRSKLESYMQLFIHPARQNGGASLRSVTVQLIRKYFRKAMKAYEDGVSDVLEVLNKVK